MNLEDLKIPEDMIKRLNMAADLLRGSDGIVHVITHYDGDGIASNAILSRVLYRLGKLFQSETRKGLGTETLANILTEDSTSGLFIFADMGSAYMADISAISESTEPHNRQFIILDHHVFDFPGSENIINVNGREWGFDGGREVCGSTTAFLFAIAVDSSNFDLLPIALAGAYGDKQNLSGWTGVNRMLVEKGISEGIIENRPGPHIFGPTVLSALYKSIDPFLSGISGYKDAAAEILEKLNIDPNTSLAKLNMESEEGKNIVKRLNSFILTHLLRNGVSLEVAKTAVTPRIFGGAKSVCPDADVEELNNVADAAGRMGKTTEAISFYLGSQTGYSECLREREQYRTSLRNYLLAFENAPPHKMDALQYFHTPTGEDTICGAIAGLGMEYLLDQDKVTIGMSEVGDKVKISGRATSALVKSGVDLAEAMHRAATAYQGNGGGHPIAAGATVPKEKIDNFLSSLNEIIMHQRRDNLNAA